MASEIRLIDANAFYSYLEDLRQDYIAEDSQSSDFAAEVIETVQDVYLANAPTVDAAEVIHGQWVRDGEDVFHCSFCGYADAFPHMDDGVQPHKYCPECGAIMDGGADNGI